MPTVDNARYGYPCWIDLTTTDLEKARSFYAALFTWSFQDMGPEFGNYHLISIGNDVVGGAMQYNAEFMGPDPINAWSLYFATEDVDSSIAKAVELGGKSHTPTMQVGEQGTMGEILDPSGALVGLWQPGQRKGFDRYGEHGFPGWFELHTRDFNATTTFYRALFNAEIGIEEMSDSMRYHTLRVDGRDVAGIWDIVGVLPDDYPAEWNTYLIANDVDAALEVARTHGATVLMEPEDTPYGRMATIQDPAGAIFNLNDQSEL